MTPEVGGECYVAHGEYGESSTSDEHVPNERIATSHEGKGSEFVLEGRAGTTVLRIVQSGFVGHDSLERLGRLRPDGAAAHMGRRDIADLLLDRGARLDLFAAAMLGHVEIVRAIVDAYAAMREAAGPHGIPLVEHARQGGPEAAAVVELLERAAV